jgi:phenylalanyl-tRNA synthetase alpha chain
MLRTLQEMEDEATASLAAASTPEALASWKRTYLGRSGRLSALLRYLGDLPVEQRPIVGRRANELKARLQEAWAANEPRLRPSRPETNLDVSLPGRPPGIARVHPVATTMRRMRSAFAQMGFQVFEGRDVETDEYNFQMLNMLPGHPARDSQDSFYTARPDIVLRTHTSPAQVRIMRRRGIPIRAVVPGTCYRRDQPDASHNVMFYQMEGMALGANIHMSDLLGAIQGLVRLLFGTSSRIRFRGHFFPFTEPSIESDLQCTVCNGAGCRLCKESGWVEIIPGGMIHPTVLRNGGVDPSRYSGFAFGAGVDRIAALWYRIPDIRLLYENDLDFLEQF